MNARGLLAGTGTLLSILFYVVTRSSGYSVDPRSYAVTGTALADSSYVSLASTSFQPVEVSYEGLNREQGHIYYAIKVNTVRRVDRVELSVRYLDDAGRLVFEAPYVWKNQDGAKPRPIEAGKTYEVEDYLYPGAVGSEVRLVRLVFADQRTWQPAR